jgi:phosphoribosylanthranilate isomerase
MKVKICGVTHPEDAKLAAQLGADYIGVIFSHVSKRFVSLSQAKKISRAARENGARVVGVFVDESADEIQAYCKLVEIDIVQLHGAVARQHLSTLEGLFPLVYAISVGLDGSVSQMPQLPSYVTPLFDCQAGGSGKPFDQRAFAPPQEGRWMLGGGLTPESVGPAIRLLRPAGVDCATGVKRPGGTRKDPQLLETFIRNAKEAL